MQVDSVLEIKKNLGLLLTLFGDILFIFSSETLNFSALAGLL